jgi:photosystem I P700 chlorophyll a apoprotein A2
MTEENLYPENFRFTFRSFSNYLLWTAGNLFHVAWQGNFETWVGNPLKVKPIAHAIWDPHLVNQQ